MNGFLRADTSQANIVSTADTDNYNTILTKRRQTRDAPFMH